MVLQPVKAVIVLFPDSKEFAEERNAEDLRLADSARQEKLNPTIFWMKQTVCYTSESWYHPSRPYLLFEDWECLWDYGSHSRSRQCRIDDGIVGDLSD
jgi:hypothetical protein